MLTALIHHVKSAEQFAPLGDLLVEKFVQIVTELESGSSITEERQESLRRILTIVSVVCSVRQGSRMSRK